MMIRRIGALGRTYRHVQRYRDILGVLLKFGFEDLIAALKIEHYLDIGLRMISPKGRAKVESLSRAQRLRMALEELGPTFIKLGQMLSTRRDLLHPDFLTELTKLQDEVPAFSYAQVEKIVESEVQGPLADTFQALEREPLAAASIGQVHRARLADGEEVVVKVQRPGIRRIIEVDLEILLHLSTLMERLHPRRLAQDLLGHAAEVLHLAKELPAEARAVLRLARQGKLKIEVEAVGLEPLLTTQDRGSNRLSFAVVLASLIIGSSLILHADIPPKWHDIPVIGLAGYLGAGIMGFWLLISILRRGRM